MSIKIKVTVTKTYRKSTDIVVEIPSNIKVNTLNDYLYDNYEYEMNDALADAQLDCDDNLEIEDISIH